MLCAFLLWLDVIGTGIIAIMFATVGEFFPAILMAIACFAMTLLAKTISEEH